MQKTIIQEQLSKYLKSRSRQKTAVIDHVIAITGMQRKSVIRAFTREQKRSALLPKARLGRPKVYTAETDAALAWVWEQYNFPCGELIHPQIHEAIRIFTRDGMWGYSEFATQQLWDMSVASVRVRTIQMAKERGLLRGYSTTKSGPFLKSIPVFFGSWANKGPGHGQLDTVVHSGPKLMGTMAYTVNYTDVATYWQEPVAQLGKDKYDTLASLKIVRERLPFVVREFHPDSGSEFINDLAYGWCIREGILLTRSRSGKKNDNCYVEQRNRSTVRRYVGYERYDCQEAVDAMNELYEALRLYLNFFQATYKLVGKEKIVTQDGDQVTKRSKRIYDQKRSPYQRILDHPAVDQAVKDKLTDEYETLNPKVLRDRILTLTSKLERVQKGLGYHY